MTTRTASYGLLLLSLLSLFIRTEASLLHPYMVHIPDRGTKCVSEKVNAQHPTLNVLWEVSAGPSFLIDVQVTAENKKMVWQEMAEEGSKEISDLTPGMYKVCFINHDTGMLLLDNSLLHTIVSYRAMIGDPGYKEVSFHVKSGPAKVTTVGLPIEEGIEALVRLLLSKYDVILIGIQ